MNDYITREEALAVFGDIHPLDHNANAYRTRIKKIPAADVRPVVRGEWLKSPECPEEYDICSVCGLNDKHRSRGNAEHPAIESIPPFCKWCGADMRKEEEHEHLD